MKEDPNPLTILAGVLIALAAIYIAVGMLGLAAARSLGLTP
jgi:hypothetical protein